MVNLVYIALLIGFALVLVKATELVAGALKKLSRATSVRQFGITAFLLALTTSLPEMFVGVIAAIEGKPGVAVGNVLGANISNLSLVVGGAAVVGGGLSVVGTFLKRDLYLTFFAGSLPLLLLMNGRLDRFDGLVLIVVYVIYILTVLKEQSKKMANEEIQDEPVFRRLFERFHNNHGERALLKLILGVALLLVAAHVIVQLTFQLASGFGVSVLFVSLILVSLGTTLPELAFGIRAVKTRSSGMVFGNLLGSIVANSTLVLGVTSIIQPFTLDGGMRAYLLATVIFIALFMMFWLFSSTKKRLERWEGGALLAFYLLFIILEIW